MENNINLEKNIKKSEKLDFKESKYATGRRKKSIAKIWVKKGTGKIFVNGCNLVPSPPAITTIGTFNFFFFNFIIFKSFIFINYIKNRSILVQYWNDIVVFIF